MRLTFVIYDAEIPLSSHFDTEDAEVWKTELARCGRQGSLFSSLF